MKKLHNLAVLPRDSGSHAPRGNPFRCSASVVATRSVAKSAFPRRTVGRFYVGRVVGRHYDHRHPHRALVAGGAGGPRGGPDVAVHEQHPATRLGAALAPRGEGGFSCRKRMAPERPTLSWSPFISALHRGPERAGNVQPYDSAILRRAMCRPTGKCCRFSIAPANPSGGWPRVVRLFNGPPPYTNEQDVAMTSYSGVADHTTARLWDNRTDGGQPRPPKPAACCTRTRGVRMADITDGTSQTLMLAESIVIRTIR